MAKNLLYIREEDILEKQAATEKQMLDEFEKGSYTFQNPLVKLDPYVISPLAAVVLFKTEKPTAITITVRGKEKAGDISHTFPKATTHILPVLGLYADYENMVDIDEYQGARKTISIKTAPLAATVPELIHMKTTAQHLKKDLIIVTSPGGGSLTGFDYTGDVRWYISLLVRMGIKRRKNGRLLIGTHRLVHPPYFMSGIYEMDMVGKLYKEYRLPGGYHHDQFEMKNGDILVLTEDLTRGTVEDMLALIDNETGVVKKLWDFKDVLTPGDGKSGNHTEEDWFHNNAVWYDENTNSITLSGRHVDAMINIDYDTGALNWIIGDPETWSEEKQKYFFKPTGESFGWQYAQHACLVTPCGDIMCFDNGTLRSKLKEKYLMNKDNYSRGVRYKIDIDKMTIEQTWEFGKELGEDFFSQHISNVEYYEDGHYLIHSGGQQFYDGVPSETILTATTADPRARCEGVTYEIVDDKVVLEMRIVGVYYRATKLPLYYDGVNLELGSGKKAGHFAVTAPSAMPEATDVGYDLPESCLAHIIDEHDCVTLKARFEKGQNAAIAMKQGGNTLFYKVNTEGSRFAASSGAPYIEADDRNTSTTINKYGLSGKYIVEIIIDGKKYSTGIEIIC